MRKKRNSTYINKYPGDGHYYVLCDVCGKKMRAREGVLIQDKYNTLNGLFVCKKDADETNPQQYIRSIPERQISNPALIRSEGPNQFVFINNADEIEDGDTSNPSGTVPSVPKHLTVIGASSSFVELQWLGPDSAGTGAISGWKIERESPVGGGFSTLVSDTATVAMYYKDETVSASTQYNYRVSAINNAGTGNPSNEASITTNS